MLSGSRIGCRLKFPQACKVPTKNLRCALSAAAQNEMKDEYGKMDSSGETFEVSDFILESGRVLKKAQVSLPMKNWFVLSHDIAHMILTIPINR